MLIILAHTVRMERASPSLLGRELLQTYFKTFDYPFTRHHIDSYDQFLSIDLPAIIRANNPLLNLKELIPDTNTYMYRTEIFVGGLDGDKIRIGTPTISLQKTKEVRLLFPNEARLRNLTYSATVFADIVVRLTITTPALAAALTAGTAEPPEPTLFTFENVALFRIPIMLHSRFCLLHGKPQSFLREAGECPQDQGGYFVVEGAEKVLITKQEQAFNTLYCLRQDNNPKVETYGNITCLSPTTRQTKVVAFYWMRSTDTLVVSIPFVRKAVPIFVLFRAMGVQSDEDILRIIFPDLNSPEAEMMIPLLLPSLAEAYPFLDQYSAIQYIKVLTKGFSEAHVLDILYNQVFIHIQDRKASRVHFLADCVRKFLRVHTKLDPKTDRDDTRNQRCLTSGFLVRMLFQNVYAGWKKRVLIEGVDTTYNYNRTTYSGEKFKDIFSPGNAARIFFPGSMTEDIMRGFKGKWVTGGAGGGGALGHSDEKTGVLQAMSRLSYLDFMSHCRRVVLNFDTGMKLPQPRQLHTSQYGYYCTSETPSGASIGIAKNLSLLTLISTNTDPTTLVNLLISRGWMIPCSEVIPQLQQAAVPVFVNNGIVGYSIQPQLLTTVLKLMKWTACLPALASVSFSIRDRRILIFLDEGRPARPLIHLGEGGTLDEETLRSTKVWRTLVLGTLPLTQERGISTTGIVDPFSERSGAIPLEEYKTLLEPHAGIIEYVDPFEQNESFIVNFKEELTPDTSHMEIHPSTIVSILTSMIPFANHNQSPRNQLSCSQSKQGLSIYASNFQNRFDNSANILCYGESPLVRTMAYDVLGEGKMPYGTTITLAMATYSGFNRDDGILFNADSIARGLFRSINYRTYEGFEEVDRMAQTTTRIANPQRVPAWLDLKPGLDYSKLDERGIIKVGELVDENTVIIGKYLQTKAGTIKDSSITPQVWTTGRVEKVVVTVNNIGHRLVKIRIAQDRIPELGDKFSNRHGQKGTMGMLLRAQDMPRTKDGLVPDIVMNPHAIPSRMTIAQLLETLFGKAMLMSGAIGDASLFMNDETVTERIGNVLQEQFGMERYGNEIMYNGQTGQMMESSIFIGPVFEMRLKHMVEDKWNARAEGRREQRTHQPTGGRGNQGGLRIGEMERDAIACHGASDFLQESFLKRSDGTTMRICNGCGTVPIYNDKEGILVCPLCDGPVKFMGGTADTLEILPTAKRSLITTSQVNIPYAVKVLNDELSAYMNMGLRFLTGHDVSKLYMPPALEAMEETDIKKLVEMSLPDVVLPETRIPEYKEEKTEAEAAAEDLAALGVKLEVQEVDTSAGGAPEVPAAADMAGAIEVGGSPEYSEAVTLAAMRPLTPGYGPVAAPAFAGTPPGTPPVSPGPPPLAAAPQAQAAPQFYQVATRDQLPPGAPNFGYQYPVAQNMQYLGYGYGYGYNYPQGVVGPAANAAFAAQQAAFTGAPGQPPASPPYRPLTPEENYGEASPAYAATTPPGAPAAAVQILPPPVPGGPVTLVVPGAMEGAPEKETSIGAVKQMGGGGFGSRIRHTTPRARRGPAMPEGASGPPAPHTKITITKLG
jgi:DNA-directed RNA polymerase II subunit RPB2